MAHVLPSGGGKALMNVDDAALLLLDHQDGLFLTVKDITIAEFAPHARYVPRQGEVNAWDNEAYVKAVHETGKKTLIMAGVWTSVCVMFPTLDAKAAGFNVYAVMDASGDPTEMASRTTLARFTQAGIVPTSTNVVICELHRTWRRPEAAEIAEIYTVATPNYRAVMECYQNAKR